MVRAAVKVPKYIGQYIRSGFNDQVQLSFVHVEGLIPFTDQW